MWGGGGRHAQAGRKHTRREAQDDLKRGGDEDEEGRSGTLRAQREEESERERREGFRWGMGKAAMTDKESTEGV